MSLFWNNSIKKIEMIEVLFEPQFVLLVSFFYIVVNVVVYAVVSATPVRSVIACIGMLSVLVSPDA